MSSEDQSAAAVALKATEKSNYYKWNASTSTRAEELKSLGVDCTPKPICSPTAGPETSGTPSAGAATTASGTNTPASDSAAANSTAVVSPKPVGSVWNTAGTWEERNVTEPARAALYEVLSSFSTDITVAGTSGTITLSSPSVDEGKITLVFTRGKVKPGFNLEVSASYNFGDDATAAAAAATTGKVTLVDFSDTEGSDMFSRLKVTVSSNGSASAGVSNDAVAKQVKEGLTPVLRERLRDWLEVIRAM